jgi:hypothetical protein
MADVDVEQWLEGWVENNLDRPDTVPSTAGLRSQAEICTAEAVVAGISPDELASAAGGNLAAYFADREVAMTSPE